MSKIRPSCKACKLDITFDDEIAIIYQAPNYDKVVYHVDCLEMTPVEFSCFTKDEEYVGQVEVADIMDAFMHFDFDGEDLENERD
ncbi:MULTISPECIES: hypothetical protein [Listeria]|uniref:hypothetical protein n=1 Tax=Listeria TaxID=1637 RepID=UPI000B58933F|nr:MULTISPECIES: hypothetical protein [Listeria]